MSAIVLLVLLLVVVAWLTAAATAVRAVSRIWLRHWVEQRLSGATAAELYLERPHRLLIAASTGVALAVFFGGALIAAAYPVQALPLVERLVLAAFLALVLGQIVPRAAARRWATRLLPFLLPVLRLFDLVVAPFYHVAAFAARWRRREPPLAPAAAAREEIEDLLREGELEGVGEHAEIAIITGVVHFGAKTLDEVMTPLEELFAVEASTPPAEMAQRIAQSAYSRVPIYRGTVDDIVGMVHVFDVLKAGGAEPPRLRQVAYASPTKHCNELLFEMLRARRHLAVVRDDAGHTLGIVTMEDLLEELVGDIRDEHDEHDEAPPAPATESR